MSKNNIDGSPVEIGFTKRRLFGNAWEGLQKPFAPDYERVKVFRQILENVAPEWLLEAESFAKDEILEYLDYQCRRPEPTPDTLCDANCSTLLALGSHAKGGHSLLLKIRDEAPNPQILFHQKLDARYAVLAGTNVGNMGFAQMVNSAGLMGGNNTGGPISDQNLEPGLNDCLVLRLIAERCATCQEALALVRQLAAEKYLGVAGYARGMIFLLADATGEGMIIECTRTEVYSKVFTDGIFVRTNHFLFEEMEPRTDHSRLEEASMKSSYERYSRMTMLAGEKILSPQDLMDISRDQSGTYPLCQVKSQFPWRTVSSWIHEIGHDDSNITTYACNQAPVLSSYSVFKTKKL